MYSFTLEFTHDQKNPCCWLGDENGNNEELTDNDVFKMLELFMYWKYGDEDIKYLFNKIDCIIEPLR